MPTVHKKPIPSLITVDSNLGHRKSGLLRDKISYSDSLVRVGGKEKIVQNLECAIPGSPGQRKALPDMFAKMLPIE